MLMFGLRLGQHPRVVVATTPRPTKLVRGLLARQGHDVVVTRGSTYENRDNLAPGFFTHIVNKYEGTRLGRQELLAEVLSDTPGALWRLEQIDLARREWAPELQRVVVGIDLAVSSSEGSDETGIIVCGRDERGHGYVLEDLSGRYDPAGWASAAIRAYYRHGADRIVAEVNMGGDMVESTLRTIDTNVSYTAVRASRGKFTRAEPVAALYDQGRVHHVGGFPELEDQMAGFVADLDRAKFGSPDRVDALVWALTELLIQHVPFAGLLEFYRADTARMRAEQAGAILNG
jgi:predicted phage terminase large subunit-like protein